MSRKRPENDDLHEYGLDVQKRTVYLDGEINMELAIRTIKNISVLERLSKEDPIRLLINSEGGDMVQGFAIIDAIRLSAAPVDGIVCGTAESAAFIILQGCRVRGATANSILMTHAGTRTTKFDFDIDLRADQLSLTRLQERDPSWTMAKWQKYQSFDRYMFPEEALQIGALDEIL
jgi:ATP-dependent Clp protease, protease subunit